MKQIDTTAGPETMIATPIDYDGYGKQADFLRLHHSGETNGYGYVPIPVICIRNGTGPTALLIGGNHGNEYEGIVSLMKLARDIEVKDVQGRIIILPALNFPAVMAGCRSSPLDDRNLNRCFPGDPHGSPTQKIAHYVSSELLPLVDVVVDLHAGGRSSSFIPCALVRRGYDTASEAALVELMQVFGAPISFVSSGKGGGGGLTLAGESSRQRVPCLTAELGGGETLSEEGLDIADEGVRRILKHFSILPDIQVNPASKTRLMAKDESCRVHAEVGGIFEPLAKLGDVIEPGQLGGLVHFPDYPMREPDPVHFSSRGMIVSRHIPALVSRGDELYTFMHDVVPDGVS